MRISAQDEYSLRIMLCISSHGRLSINQISKLEEISEPNIAKITRLLRKAGLLNSVLGPNGGYELINLPKDISLNRIINAVNGSLYDAEYCGIAKGDCNVCVHLNECSIRPLWSFIQTEINKVLSRLTLEDLGKSESKVSEILS